MYIYGNTDLITQTNCAITVRRISGVRSGRTCRWRGGGGGGGGGRSHLTVVLTRDYYILNTTLGGEVTSRSSIYSSEIIFSIPLWHKKKSTNSMIQAVNDAIGGHTEHRTWYIPASAWLLH